MLYGLITQNPSSKDDLITIGFIESGLSLKPLVLDAPAGSVARVIEYATLRYPSVPAEFSRYGIPLIVFLIRLKLLLEEVINKFKSPDTTLEFDYISIQPISFHFTLMTSSNSDKTNNDKDESLKKQRVEQEEQYEED